VCQPVIIVTLNRTEALLAWLIQLRNKLLVFPVTLIEQAVFSSLQEMQHQRRRLSVTEAYNIPESSYYQVHNKPTTNDSTPGDHILDKTFQDDNGSVRYKDTSPLTFSMPLLGNIVFDNQLLAASAMYGCFMTMSSYYNSNAHIPENLKVKYIHCIVIDFSR
jgi:hypothetical protein